MSSSRERRETDYGQRVGRVDRRERRVVFSQNELGSGVVRRNVAVDGVNARCLADLTRR